MANVIIDNAHNLPDPGFGGVAYGNVFSLPFNITTNASGVIVGSDTATAVGNGDVIYCGVIPAGTKLLDMKMFVSDAFAGSVTFAVGFKYKDGVDVAAVPQDDDFFCAATSVAATGVTRKTNVTPPVTIPKDAYLIVTSAGAAHSAAGICNIEIQGVIGGPH